LTAEDRLPFALMISHFLSLYHSNLQETSEVNSKERQAKREQAFVPPVEKAPRNKGAAGKAAATAPLDVAALKKSLKREAKATGVQNAKDYVLPSKKVKRDKKKGGEA